MSQQPFSQRFTLETYK
jgi:hypothetical protein